MWWGIFWLVIGGSALFHAAVTDIKADKNTDAFGSVLVAAILIPTGLAVLGVLR